MKKMLSLFLLASTFCFGLSNEYIFGSDLNPRYILGETEEARVFEMSDYSFVFKMGDHFYQPQHLFHLKDCPTCLADKKAREKTTPIP